jgi:hypothetical protein
VTFISAARGGCPAHHRPIEIYSTEKTVDDADNVIELEIGER